MKDYTFFISVEKEDHPSPTSICYKLRASRRDPFLSKMTRKLIQLVSFQIFFILLQLLISAPICLSIQSPLQEDSFDFIIVGGGTAGLALARRLADAQNKRFSVLVLESGDEPREGSDIPAFSNRFVSNPDVTFRYRSTPQKNAGLRSNGSLTLFSGRMLSGTSNLNLMFYNRGSSRDYDNWSNLTHDPSWNYSNMLKYFKRTETYRGDYPSDQHGYSGPLTISRPKYAPGLNFWLEAGRSLGYNIADPNGPQRISFTAVEFAKKFGRRVNSLSGYINPIRGSSPNLHIITNTNATKILFKKRQAYGVCFQSTNPLLRNLPDNCVYARMEIVISAGAYGSPLLLLRSGVGPKQDLREANIPVIKDSPVGLNLQDHVAVNIPFIINNSLLVMDEERDLNPHNFELYKAFGDGPFSNGMGSTGQAFVASSVAKSEGDGDWADLHLIVSHGKQGYFRTGLAGNDSIQSWEAPMYAGVYMSRPKSRGSLKLDPSEPDGPPIIDVGFLEDPQDTRKVLDGVYHMMKFFESPAYRSIGARFPRDLNLPGCAGLRFRSRKWWECYIRYNSQSGRHPAGSCKMGKRGDPDAVIDSELRVIGIEGLRVVDASIMPVVTNANTQAPVYGIAEKASDMILNDWKH